MTHPIHMQKVNVNSQRVQIYYYCYHRFMTLCPGLPEWVGTRRINHSGFCWSRHDGVAVASAEPYTSYFHFAPEDNHASTSSVRLLWARFPSWHPTNSVKTLKARNIPYKEKLYNKIRVTEFSVHTISKKIHGVFDPLRPNVTDSIFHSWHKTQPHIKHVNYNGAHQCIS